MGYIPSGTRLTIRNELYKRGAKPGLVDLKYSYEGKKVKKLIDFIPKLVKTVFNPTTWQQELVETKEGGYSASWRVFKDLDYYTYLRFDLKLEIEFRGDEGKATIVIGEPCIVSEYPQETYWQKTFIYEIFRVLWHNLFYNKKVEEYMDWGRTQISCFEEKLFAYFDKLRE